MSRTYRRKTLKRAPNDSWTKAYGYNAEMVWRDNGDTVFTGWRPSTTLEIYHRLRCLHGDKIDYPWLYRNCMKPWSRRIVEKENRARESGKIRRFMKGITDDIIAGTIQKRPKEYWD